MAAYRHVDVIEFPVDVESELYGGEARSGIMWVGSGERVSAAQTIFDIRQSVL